MISVLMAVHNEETYVAAAIESILDQTFSDFEFLIVDDGSTDATPEILRRYQDERIHVISVNSNGLTRALNTGLGIAKGEFVARMDADDWSAPERLEIQVQVAQADDNMALVGSWYNIVDEDGTFLALQSPPTSNAELRAALDRGNPFCHGSVLLRRADVSSVGGYRPSFRSSQDYDLWLRLSERFATGRVPKALYTWRLRRGSVGTRQRMVQRAYGKAAHVCAQQRKLGLRETLPPEHQKVSALLHFRPLDYLATESGYEASKANILLGQGQYRRALKSAVRSVAHSPWSPVALAALFRTTRSLLASGFRP